MAVGDNVLNEVVGSISPDAIANIGTLITILQAAGIIAIIYFIIVIVGAILNIRRTLMIRKVYDKIKEIDEKIDKILRKENFEKIGKSKFSKDNHKSNGKRKNMDANKRK